MEQADAARLRNRVVVDAIADFSNQGVRELEAQAVVELVLEATADREFLFDSAAATPLHLHGTLEGLRSLALLVELALQAQMAIAQPAPVRAGQELDDGEADGHDHGEYPEPHGAYPPARCSAAARGHSWRVLPRASTGSV